MQQLKGLLKLQFYTEVSGQKYIYKEAYFTAILHH